MCQERLLLVLDGFQVRREVMRDGQVALLHLLVKHHQVVCCMY